MSADPLRPADARVGVFTGGLWRRRAVVAALTGMRPARRFWSARGLDAVCGWGHKPTAARARAAAARAGLPYVALEDGFLRSLRPGADEPAASYVVDPVGIYYDATRPSRLEALVAARAADPAAAAAAAAPAFDALRRLGLSKYNDFEPAEPALAGLGPDPGRVALVVDQTEGDAAVLGAGADGGTFRAMLAAAAAENPGAILAVKTHPETTLGRRAGHLGAREIAAAAAGSPALAAALAGNRVRMLTARIRPRDLFARVGRVYAVSSLLGLEALAAGRPVVCFGAAFYAGWGLTDDRAPPTGRRGPAPLAALVAAAYVDYSAYFCPYSQVRCSIETAAVGLARRIRESAGLSRAKGDGSE
jgi:capsule polysaccharide export protein KpsC/LpsZ